jgi:hypothetical protein
MGSLLDKDIFVKIKQNAKETIEFAVKSINWELVALYLPHQEQGMFLPAFDIDAH